MRFDDATLRAYVSGLLEPPEARQVAQWASRDPALRRRLTALAAQAMRPAPTPTRRFWLPPAGPHLVSDPDALGVLGGSMVLSGERFAVWLPTVEDAEDRTIVVLRRDEDETDWRVVEPLQPEAQVRLDALPVQEEGRRQLQLRAEGEGRQRWAVVLPAAETLDWTHDDPFRTLASLLHDNEVDAVSVRIEVQRRGGSGSSGGSGGSGPTDPDVAPSDPQVTRDATVPVQTQSVVSDEEVAGRYVLGPLIGAGGFGRVWAATDRLTGDEVALKRVPALSDQQERQVRAELAALRFARLPGVVRLRDEGRHGADWFLVMDRIAGRRFPGRVAGAEDERRAVTLYGDPVLTWAELRPRLLRLLEVLARVHAVGLVHRDLKPSNVLVDDEGAVTLLDFGLATGRATATGVSGFAGTPRYASPEQARRESVGPSSDLFSVGLMALEALGADLGDPFDVPSVLARRRAEPLPDVAALVPGLDDETVAWLNTMVAFDPAARLPTALDALRALGGPVAGGAPQLPEGTGPLTAMELRPLFAGPEAFLHLPEDSAAELWARTRGDRELVQAELEAWMRAGVAHLVDGQLQLDRAGIARLAAGMRTAVRRAAPTDGLSPEALRTLGYLELAWPHATEALIETLGVAEGLPELLDAGIVWWLPDDRLGMAPVLQPARNASSEERLEMVEQLLESLPQRHPVTVALLLVAGHQQAALEAALSIGRDQELGDHDARAGFLRLCADLAMSLRQESALGAALDALAEHALAGETPHAVELALTDFDRARAAGFGADTHHATTQLLRAARAVRRGEWGRAERNLSEVSRFSNESLEQYRAGTFLQVEAPSSGKSFHERCLQLESWAMQGPPARVSRWQGWMGLAHYRNGNFERSAESHLQASAGKSGPPMVASLINAADAYAEALQLEQARTIACRAQEVARDLRHPHFEAYSTWVMRKSDYRLERRLSPLAHLVTAARDVADSITGFIAVTESAIAWRVDDFQLANLLANQARDSARRCSHPALTTIARGLVAATCDVEETEIQRWIAEAVQCEVREIAAQALALFSLRTSLPQNTRCTALEWAKTTRNTNDMRIRLDVVSMQEAIQFLETGGNP